MKTVVEAEAFLKMTPSNLQLRIIFVLLAETPGSSNLIICTLKNESISFLNGSRNLCNKIDDRIYHNSGNKDENDDKDEDD